MSKINIRVLPEKKNKYVSQKSLVFTKGKKGKFNKTDVENIYDQLNKETKEIGDRFIIRGLSAVGMFTLKSLNGKLKILDEDEYLEGRVKETTKFEWFSQLQILKVSDIKPNFKKAFKIKNNVL